MLCIFQKKCDQYWPQEGKDIYGDIQVTAVGQNVMATYTIRKFCLRHLKVGQQYLAMVYVVTD